jgi:two-component system sensor histidine kinase VicK
MKQRLSNTFHLFEEAAKRTDKVYFAFDIKTKQFLYLNPAFEQLLNKSIEDIYKKTEYLLESIHAEDRKYLFQVYHEIINGEEKKEVEFRIQYPDGSFRWILMAPFLIEESGKSVLVGVAEDYTNRRDKNQNMQEFAAKKDSIMEILSHDLAGPLNNIKGIAAVLADELKGKEHPKLDKLTRIIEETSERSIRLIREFVKVEFLQSEKSELVKVRVDMVEKMKEVLEQYEGSEHEIQKTFHFNISDEPIFASIDLYKFTQVLNNLISNAIKFTGDEGEITVTLKDKQENIFISVADNGIGIPAKYHENLFEKFTKARRNGLKGEPSTGLGMSIIKTIVEWHNGKIWFESEENKGTAFYLEIPKE